MAKKSLIGALAFAGLALAGNAYAQNQKPVEPTQYSQSKDISYTNEQIALLISKYQGYITEIAKEKRGPNYPKSLEKLSKGASDGTFYPSELIGIDEGTYMIIKRGKDKAKGEYSIPILVRLGNGKSLNRTQDFILLSNPIYSLSLTEKTPINDLASGGNVTSIEAVDAIAGIKNIITYLNMQRKDNKTPCEKPKVFYDEIDGKKIILDYAGAPTDDSISKAIKEDINKGQAENELRREEMKARNKYSKPNQYNETQELIEKGKKGTLFDLVLEVSENLKFNNLGLGAGFMVHPFEDKEAGFGIVGDVSFGKNKILDSYKDNLIDNLTAAGTVEATHNFSVGASFEVEMGRGFLGFGMGYDNRIVKKKVEVREGNEVIKSNSDSAPEKEAYAKAYLGMKILKTKGFDMGIFWESKLQKSNIEPRFGLRTNIKFGAKK